jgi:hypothetical protein
MRWCSLVPFLVGCLSDIVPPDAPQPHYHDDLGMHDAAPPPPPPAPARPQVDAGGSPPPAPTCGQQTFPVTVTRKTPNVMLVVDDSGSMADPVGNSTQAKWDALRMAVEALLAKYPDAVQWGLSIFPQPLGDADSCSPGAIDVPIGPGNGTKIAAKLNAIIASTLSGSTPTPETLGAIQAARALSDTKNDNYILLVTDGVPTCAPASGVATTISALYAQTPSVRTFVVGIGNETESNPTLLDEWAVAGHTARSGTPKYYQVNTLTDLTGSIDTILGAVASCNYALAQKPDDPSLLTAYFDGKAVPIDPANGVTYDAASQSLVFHGAACDQIKKPSVMKIDVVYGCPSPVIS